MDIDLLRRFVLGECNASERERVARWVAEDDGRRGVIEAVRRLLDEPQAWTGEFDARAAWPRLLRSVRRRERIVQVRGEHAARLAGGAGRRMAAWALAAGVLIALGVRMSWRPLARLLSQPAPAVAMRSVTTRRGQRAVIALTDGTRVQLAADSRITYPAAFTAGVRAVTLDGEAYFDVRHDEAHPFEVRTRTGVVRDVGTAFLVRQYNDDARLEVVVAAGRVAVAGITMNAGHMLRVDSVGRADVTAVDAQRYLGWMHGSLVFDDTPLGEVAAELSRWYDADVTLADTAIARRRFTGTFGDEPLDSIVRALAVPMHVRVERRGRSIRFFPLPNHR